MHVRFVEGGYGKAATQVHSPGVRSDQVGNVVKANHLATGQGKAARQAALASAKNRTILEDDVCLQSNALNSS
jgi:hypothetical protein